ncbi:MAG: carbohydrate ABC transporter permease [Atribacterota bacterium]|jgi:multiple sugar transport system permease protein|nr:carbohydrate ABC transporter permease [Atribacterota bacterium]MDD4895668.1 carbohydrate ABC transporter permease [Atribacterota bacterium]MDD5636665.1 carbohydrate ABC transporter permease [Atribacterota bacterium]
MTTKKQKKNNKKNLKLINIIGTILVIIVALISVIPFLWIVMSAFKDRMDIMSPTISLFFKPTLANFKDAFGSSGGFSIYLRNSLIIGIANVILCLITGVPAAYSFSRYYILGAKHLYFYILTTRMCPGVAVALPLYIWFKNLNILGTIPGVILAHTTFNLALVIYLMKSLFDAIPKEIDRAALVDGYSEWQVFTKVILPIAKPAIASTAFLAFIYSWNEFLFALILGGRAARTLPSAFPGLVTALGTYWGQLCAVSAVVAIPVILMAVFLQRYLVQGLTLGAVKG